MSYESRLTGSVKLEPSDAGPRLEAFAGRAPTKAGRLVVKRKALHLEDCFDWEEGLGLLERARTELDLSFRGKLQAIGEDERRLARIVYDDDEPEVTRAKADDFSST